MVVIQNLEVRKEGTLICSVADLQIANNDRVAVTGPNGCGKTTLLRVIGGLEADYSGSVSVGACGRVYVHQAPYLFRGTAESNVEYGLAVKRIRKSQRRLAALEWLERLGIGHIAQLDTRRLSGGERRRVALARAFATEPAVLLLDEPFADLDEAGVEAVVRVINSAEKSTILITTPVTLDFLSIRSFEIGRSDS